MALRHTDQLVVQAHRPGRRRLAVTLWLLALSLSFAAGFLLGGRFHDGAVQDNHRMAGELESLRNVNTALEQKLTNAELASEVDRGSLEEIRKLVTSLQLDLAANEEELSLYRNLLQGSDESGLEIGELMLRPQPGSGGMAYRLIIQQKASKLKSININIEVELEGVRNGIKETLGLAQLDGQVGSMPMAVTFKYFHMLEGVLNLPQGFKPGVVKVSVWKDNNSANPVERRFDWHFDEAQGT